MDNKDVTFETRMQTEYIYIYIGVLPPRAESDIYIYIFSATKAAQITKRAAMNLNSKTCFETAARMHQPPCDQ